jgi:signal transduction histidine kinase
VTPYPGKVLRRFGPGTGLSNLLQRAIIVSTALAMLLFALPLAVTVGGLYRSSALEELGRDAERARVSLTQPMLNQPALMNGALPEPHDPSVRIGVYDVNGELVAGHGTMYLESRVLQALVTGVEEQGMENGSVLAAVPLLDDLGHARFVVRAAQPASMIDRQAQLTWLAMAALALVIMLLVAGLARAQARRIARPLERLASAAEDLGDGDFSIRALDSGVAEVDAASASLERTARRLGGLLERERAFSADASHQLRTPLTAVRLGLESALITPASDLRAATTDALVDLDRLEQTVLDLLALARDTRTGQEATDVVELAVEAAGLWRRRLAEVGRSLELASDPGLPAVAVSPPALRTVLDVLMDNALTHGAGGVTVSVHSSASTVTIEVADEGEGVTGDVEQIFRRRSPEATGTGIGLALARSLVEADGGRLLVTRGRPTLFSVVVPVWRPSASANGRVEAVAETTQGGDPVAVGPGLDELAT